MKALKDLSSGCKINVKKTSRNIERGLDKMKSKKRMTTLFFYYVDCISISADCNCISWYY